MVAVQGIFIMLLPNAQNLGQFYAATLLSESGGATYDSGNAVWIIEMWNDRAPSVLQLTQMMYGLGTIVGPLITEPYVLGDLTEGTNLTIAMVNSTNSVFNKTSDEDINYSVDRRSNLKVPFLIGGGSTLIG